MMTPGMKTSEFWIGLITPMFMTVMNSVMGWQINPEMLMSMFGGGGAYAIGRGLAKQTYKMK